MGTVGKLRKRICVSLILGSSFLALHTVSAQHPWNFATLQEACLDDAYLVQPADSLCKRVAKGTLSPNGGGQPLAYNARYHMSGPYRCPEGVSAFRAFSSQRFYRFQNPSCDVYLPEGLAAELLPHLVSCSYWERRFRTLLQWSYVKADNGLLLEVDTTGTLLGAYSPLTWLDYAFRPSERYPVVFTVRTNTHASQTLTLAAVDRLAEWGSFASDADFSLFESQQQARSRSQAEQQAQLQRQLDSLNSVSELIARHADSISNALMHDSMLFVEEQMRADVTATKERMNRDQIFIMSINPARSDYMFGLEFNLYNCFAKTIAKVEITVMPINDRGQVQPDKFHRRERSVRGMGPILPGAPAQFLFDELFWNDNGRIKFMRVTSVTLHFSDGTRRTFNGYEKIRRHSLSL